MSLKRATTTVLATAVLALLGAVPADADSRTDVRDLAAANLHKQTCSTNSLGGVGFMDSCRMQWAWCADFVRWVWGNRNLNTDRLTAAAGSFYLYGQQKGTLHTDPGYVPQVGDAVVFRYQGNGYAEHVAMVDTVNADGTIRTINGNWGNGGPGTTSVEYFTGPGRVGQSIAGQPISAFVSPVGLTDPAKPVTPRLGVLFKDSSVQVKEGNLYAGWTAVHGGGIVKSEVHGDMVGVLTAGGDLYVKQGNLYQEWVLQANNVKDFALESAAGRIGVLRTDGTVAVKEGGLQGGWVEETNNAKEVELSGDYIAVVDNNGAVFAKQGNLYAGWVGELSGGADVELDASTGRIAVVRTDGSLTVKEGGLYGTWVEQASGVKQVDLSGDYLGVVFADGLASVKQGNLYAGWINQLSGAAKIEVDAPTGRVGALRTDGSLTVKDGGPYGAWVEQTGGAGDFQLTDY
ncbi:CHAP domain-containing protein [Amycolatopsis sp. NPDC049688]|uniref:CHAP domain-containing protein n=1 Tax=Amycolatopsis sp. NPDC049688 TaxID=3154733 RepID=UPI00343082FF